MSNYVYTNTNNAISIGKLTQGPDGPVGYAGPKGPDGPQGVIGPQGNKGADDLSKTDISFSGTSTASHTVNAGKLRLIGHVIFNNLQALNTVKVIAGVHTSGSAAEAGIWLINHTTQNSSKIVIAETTFPANGYGLIKDFRVRNLNIDPSKWPNNEDVLGVWAYIGNTKKEINKIIQGFNTSYGGQLAVLKKESLEKEGSVERKYVYNALEKDYNIEVTSTTADDLEQLKEEIIKEDELVAKQFKEYVITDNLQATQTDSAKKVFKPTPISANIPKLLISFLELS